MIGEQEYPVRQSPMKKNLLTPDIIPITPGLFCIEFSPSAINNRNSRCTCHNAAIGAYFYQRCLWLAILFL